MIMSCPEIIDLGRKFLYGRIVIYDSIMDRDSHGYGRLSVIESGKLSFCHYYLSYRVRKLLRILPAV